MLKQAERNVDVKFLKNSEYFASGLHSYEKCHYLPQQNQYFRPYYILNRHL